MIIKKMSYDLLNRINRAMDIYNFPKYNSTLLYLQSIRVLYDKRKYKNSLNLKYIPSEQELREKVISLYYNIITNNLMDNPNRNQEYNELMDVAIHLNVTLPTIDLQQQYHGFAQYEQYVNINRRSNSISTKELKDIIKDKQNVHDTGINESVKQNVLKLFNLYKDIILERNESHEIEKIQEELIRRKTWNSANFKSLEYIKKNISTFGIDITLKQLLICVWFHITKKLQDHKEELLDILNEELKEMSGTCSTGHMSRLINVLQGFDSSLEIQTREGIQEYIKKHIYNVLNKAVEKAPEKIVESILEQPEIYKDWLNQEYQRIYKKKWIDKFGLEYNDYVDTIFEEYTGNSTSKT
jgi:hypothetical protein